LTLPRRLQYQNKCLAAADVAIRHILYGKSIKLLKGQTMSLKQFPHAHRHLSIAATASAGFGPVVVCGRTHLSFLKNSFYDCKERLLG
jgi:hypothetical protein